VINVKYFGSSDIPAFEKNFGSMDELIRENPFRPFGKENKIGPTGKGYELEKDNHASLKRLEWSISGHFGMAEKYAGWDENGKPVYLEGGSGVNGSVFGIDISETSIFVQGRKAILFSPSPDYVGAEWDLSLGQSFSPPAPMQTVTYYFGLDPDDESVCGITSASSDFPVSIRLYTIIGVADSQPLLVRVWNSGDINIVPMWLKGSE